MGIVLACLVKPCHTAGLDTASRRDRVQGLIFGANTPSPGDSGQQQGWDHSVALTQQPFPLLSHNATTVPFPILGFLHSRQEGVPSLCRHRLAAVPNVVHFMVVRKKTVTDLEFVVAKVPVLSGQDLESLSVETELSPGSFATVQMVTFRGRPAVKKAMLSNRKLNILVREARVLLELDGAGGAPRLLAVCTEPPAMVLEFVGDTLRQFVRECGRPEVVFQTLAKVCDSVHQIHDKGFVHCDLKTNNITITGDPNDPDVHIIDLGLATPIGQAFDCTMVGIDFEHPSHPRQWMSPEMKAGRPLHAASDVYSLGVLMVRVAMLVDVPDLLPALTPLVRECTNPDPRKRPTLPQVAQRLRQLNTEQLQGVEESEAAE